jgi:hypothetical protein
MDKSSSLGMPMHHPKKYPRSTSVKAWGCPRGTPSSSAKIKSPFKTLYLYCFMHYVFFLERQLFLVFLVSLILFAAINSWTPTNFIWRRCTRFHLPRTLRFSLLSFTECSSFSATAFGFHFRLDLRSDLVISFHQGVFLPLIFIGFHQKRCL